MGKSDKIGKIRKKRKNRIWFKLRFHSSNADSTELTSPLCPWRCAIHCLASSIRNPHPSYRRDLRNIMHKMSRVWAPINIFLCNSLSFCKICGKKIQFDLMTKAPQWYFLIPFHHPSYLYLFLFEQNFKYNFAKSPFPPSHPPIFPLISASSIFSESPILNILRRLSFGPIIIILLSPGYNNTAFSETSSRHSTIQFICYSIISTLINDDIKGHNLGMKWMECP